MKLLRPGLIPYGQALSWQLELRRRLQEGRDDPGFLLCLQHPPVITLGKRGRLEDIFGLDELKARGTTFYQTDRGGEATYHGPGQLVIYPVVRLDSLDLGVVDIIRGLARSLSTTLADYDVEATYDPDHPGLWTATTPARKIASVGMRVSGGVSTHGAAINLTNDITPFSYFVPCGMPNAPLTRLADFCDEPVDVDAFTDRFLHHLSRDLQWTLEPATEAPPTTGWASPLDL